MSSVDFCVTSETTLPTSENSEPNSVIVNVETISEQIYINQTTGHQTRNSIRSPPPFRIIINDLHSASPDDIIPLIHHRFLSNPWCCVCNVLAPKVSTAATELGVGNGLTLTMAVTVTHKSVTVTSNEEEAMDVVVEGMMELEEELMKSSKMETESCSICLENLVGPNKPRELTRMTCSHVFHIQCVLEWLSRKNTCPLCRTVMYDH